jgi:phospholipid/cholesterol/gamma-HCH transport system ATP-binding protein
MGADQAHQLIDLKGERLVQRRGENPKLPKLFDQVSFYWAAPSLHVVMGTSGKGKSSFLKTIGGVWQPQSGSLLFAGQALWSNKGRQDVSTLSKIGFAFQNNALFNSLRVIENLCFPHRTRFREINESARLSLAEDWLKKVGLEHAATQYPHELSGGMQKRLAIARTLILKPDYVFLDDPTAGLDPITSKVMSDLLLSLLKGSNSLVVIVTNDPDRAKSWGPNIHFLDQGRLVSPDHSEYPAIQERFL